MMKMIGDLVMKEDFDRCYLDHFLKKTNKLLQMT